MSAETLLATLTRRGLSVATAESLTAGLVCDLLAQVPGASAAFKGGVVAYATEVKDTVLGINPMLLEHVVSQSVAEAMSQRCTVVLQSDLGLATTGVAGPDALDGQPVGTVWIAATLRGFTLSREEHFTGGRQQIREQAAAAAVALGEYILRERNAGE